MFFKVNVIKLFSVEMFLNMFICVSVDVFVRILKKLFLISCIFLFVECCEFMWNWFNRCIIVKEYKIFVILILWLFDKCYLKI